MSEEKAEYLATAEPATTIQGKPIRCPECRLVIGHVVRRGGIRHFRLEVGGFAMETAFEAAVWCPCGGLLEWHAGQEALDDLLERIKRKDSTAENTE